MASAARKRPRKIVLLIAFGLATVVALVLAEVMLRVVVTPPKGKAPLGDIGYADEQGVPVDPSDAVARGFVVPLPGEARRPRMMFAPGRFFYLTYTDNDVLQRDWFDEQSRVRHSINSRGLREREDIVYDKPSGQRRIVCLGDSFTFAWGIPIEKGWVRLLEDELRKDGADVRTVNCGASGTVCVDEYVHGLEQRFHRYEPDAVVLTICLNDLIPSSGLNFAVPPEPSFSRLLDLMRGVLGAGPLELDPDRDWVGELLALPKDQALAAKLCHPIDKPFDAMWSQGTPQQWLRRGKAWCEQRQIPFMVVIWPFLQGLGEGRHYPFQKMHDLVAADCKEAGIPLLDVLPALASTPSEDLWVTPADPHPNPLAQRLALPAIAAFVREHTHW